MVDPSIEAIRFKIDGLNVESNSIETKEMTTYIVPNYASKIIIGEDLTFSKSLISNENKLAFIGLSLTDGSFLFLTQNQNLKL
ncbi:MAG: hypothetical protein ACXAEX_21105 [Promethearchaeota archaeon]